MRIVVTADPYLALPARFEGGIERIVDLLVRGLVQRGHRVTLFGHPKSRTPARLVPYGAPPHVGLKPRAVELWQVGAGLWRLRATVDLVHSFGRLAALLPVLPLRRLPKIQSYHRYPVPWKGVRRAVRLAGPSLRLTACSDSVYSAAPSQGGGKGRWCTVYNGIEMRKYTFVPRVPADAPLVLLGRLQRIKGVHHAIAIARGAGRRLVIAGPRALSGPEAEYFHREIMPSVDGASVRYVGPVDDTQKNELLGSAQALLMPVEWEETFGLVMAEAMACGTPVIGFARGGVPEVIRDGLNGYLCRAVDEATEAVGRLHLIEREAVRRDCEVRFNGTTMVDAYERLYREALCS